MNDELIKLILQITGAKDIDEARAAAQRLEEELEELDKAQDKAAGSSRNMGRAVLEGGRFLQDFAQGGFGGVLNNIEGFTAALGGGAGLAGLLTGVGLAAYFALPRVKALFSALIDGSNEVPKSADALKRLNEEIAANGKALDALREKHALTNKELAEFNRLTEEQVRLEKEAAVEKEKRARADEVKKLKPFGEKEANAERAEAMKALFGDEKSRAALAEEVEKGLEERFNEAEEELRRNAMQPAPRDAAGRRARMEQQRAVRERIDRLREARKNPQDLVNRAIAEGREQDIRDLVQSLPILNGPGAKMRRDIAESTLPENLRRQEQEIEASEEEARAAHEAGERGRRAAQERRRRDAQRHRQQQQQTDAILRGHTRQIKEREEAGDKAEDERGRRARNALDMSRRLDAARRHPERLPQGNLPLIAPGAGRQELEAAMLQNQQQMTENMAALQRMLNQARAIGQEQRRIGRMNQQPMMNNGW